jgi:glycosyltransferase involved in cell wall biosynthesis
MGEMSTSSGTAALSPRPGERPGNLDARPEGPTATSVVTGVYRQSHNVMDLPGRKAGGEDGTSETAAERMHIAMLAPPWIPVPPPGYGGIEFVVALLSDALVDRGHDVELFCAPGSSSSATVRPLLDAAHPESIERSLFEADHVARAFGLIDAARESGREFDVVHDHCGFTPLAMADRLGTPLVHTVHGPFNEDTKPFYAEHGAKGRLVCISHSQARQAPEGVDPSAVVHNPIDVDSWPLGLHKQDYLLWIGRIVPEKGPHRAIEVAHEAKRPLILAGPVQPGYERFFATQVEPHIDGVAVRYVGEVGGARKQRLFADAFAFLMPIRWPEPFGMVIVEALAAGTPVLAFAQGAAPEIIEHGVNGFLVNDEHEMAAMVERAGELDPQRCRRSAAERFSPGKVALGYEAVYREARAGGRRAAGRQGHRQPVA